MATIRSRDLTEVDRLTDRLGLEIDERIKPLVIGLRRWGVRTIMSCEGHYGRGLPYPWVDVDISGPDGKEQWLLLRRVLNFRPCQKFAFTIEVGARKARLVPFHKEGKRSSLAQRQQAAIELGEMLREVADLPDPS